MEISAYLLSYVYLFICSQRLWKRSAICHELMVNCCWKMAIDYWGHRLENASQHLHCDQPSSQSNPQTCCASSRATSPDTTVVPPGLGERRGREEQMAFTSEMSGFSIRSWYNICLLLVMEPEGSSFGAPQLSAPFLPISSHPMFT